MDWCEYCISQGDHFLPILLDGDRGHVGPLNIPFRTPCLNCLRQRQNAHLTDSDLWRHYEKFSYSGQDIAAVHPLMVSILASSAAFEIVKYLKGIEYRLLSHILSIDYDHSSTAYEKVLKLPRCSVCSPLNRHNKISAT